MDALAVKQACKFAKEHALKNGPFVSLHISLSVNKYYYYSLYEFFFPLFCSLSCSYSFFKIEPNKYDSLRMLSKLRNHRIQCLHVWCFCVGGEWLAGNHSLVLGLDFGLIEVYLSKCFGEN